MTAHDKIVYGSFAGAIELREDIVRRAAGALGRAIYLRNAIAIVAALVAVLEIANRVAPYHGSEWLANHGLAITVGIGVAWLFAAANVWSCRQRAELSEARLADYVARLPVVE